MRAPMVWLGGISNGDRETLILLYSVPASRSARVKCLAFFEVASEFIVPTFD
jgi:hypothetical protein